MIVEISKTFVRNINILPKAVNIKSFFNKNLFEQSISLYLIIKDQFGLMLWAYNLTIFQVSVYKRAPLWGHLKQNSFAPSLV